MRSSILRLAFLFAAGIVFITGCGEGTSAAADNKGSAAVDRKANTPIETARRFVEALWKAEPDTAAAISLSDGEMKKIMKREGEKVAQIKKTAANGDKKAKAALAEWNKAVRETQFVFKGEKIDGDLATVDIVMIRDRKSKVEKVFFRKINGEWKVISENDYRIANGDRPPDDPNQFSGGGAATDALEKACRKEAAKATVAGKKLKATAAGKKALLIMPSGAKESKLGQAFVKALTENYGQVTVDEPKANPESDASISKKDIDEVLARHKDVELVIFYDTLPWSYKTEDKKVYFLFDRGSGDGKQIKNDIESGKIIGIVLRQDKVTVKASDPVEKDPEEAFKKRYILIDKGNVGANAKYFE